MWCLQRQVLLLRPRSKKVRAVTDMALHDGHWRYLLPVVLLGLLAHLLAFGGPLHW